jgi:predicted DNA-binding transcriptional regulator
MSEISKVSFKFPTVKCAELALKMKNDNARKQQFFQAVAEAYLVDDELFNKWWHNYLKTMKIPKSRLKAKIELINEGKELERDFALNEDEIENLFDILENFED